MYFLFFVILGERHELIPTIFRIKNISGDFCKKKAAVSEINMKNKETRRALYLHLVLLEKEKKITKCCRS